MNKEQSSASASSNPVQKVRVTIELSLETLAWIDELRVQLGFRNRGIIIEQLLLELQPPPDGSDLVQPRTGSGLLASSFRFLRFLRDRIPFL